MYIAIKLEMTHVLSFLFILFHFKDDLVPDKASNITNYKQSALVSLILSHKSKWPLLSTCMA